MFQLAVLVFAGGGEQSYHPCIANSQPEGALGAEGESTDWIIHEVPNGWWKFGMMKHDGIFLMSFCYGDRVCMTGDFSW